jgi:hypothetical protein
MRLVFLMQGRSVDDQPGFADACRQLQAEGALSACEILPYTALAETQGWPAVWQKATQAARAHEADAVFLQFFHVGTVDPTAFIAGLRALPSRPLVAVSSGDAAVSIFARSPPSIRIAARLADITFLSEMGRVSRALMRQGAQRLTLMPHGYCQVRFDRGFAPVSRDADYDIVFIGNRLRARNPTSTLFYGSLQRTRQVAALQRRYGTRLAIFGSGWEGWPSARGRLAFDQQQDICRRARVVVGAFPQAFADYYMSDREVIALRAGAPFVDLHVKRVDRIFEPGRHWFLYRSFREMLGHCDRLLSWNESERESFGRQVAADIAPRHSQYHRMRSMLRTMQSLRAALLAGHTPPPPELDFLLPHIALENERRYATAGWS